MLQKIKINLLSQALFLACAISLSGIANAATYTVIDNTLDSGAGSLRQAILDANANPGLDSIDFNIPGSCHHTIKPMTGLPGITSPVNINGYTQPGSAVATASSAATLCIEISGESAPLGANGLTLASGSSGSSIRGIVINRFSRVGAGAGSGGDPIIIPAAGSSGGHWIAGNYLNINAAGTATFLPAFASVRDGISDSGSGGNIIGHDPAGPNSSNPAADRNIISGGRNGIFIFLTAGFSTSINNQIRGNYIGTDVTGTVDLGNSSRGINLQTPNNTIEGNLLSGNDIHGISITGISITDNSGNNLITNNTIGTDVTGTLPLGNLTTGVAMANTVNNRIEGNVLAFNGAGVGMMASAWSNAILSNSIFGNGRLGIDLTIPFPGGVGVVNLNDPLDGDDGPNNLQNFPVLDGERSFLNPALVQVWGSLDSKPSQDYLIQVFSSELPDLLSGHGEGQALIGEATVSTDPSGHVDFHFPAKLGEPVGSILTATATDLLTMDTSEFSAWVNVDKKGSPTAYENAAGAASGDGFNGMDWELEAEAY